MLALIKFWTRVDDQTRGFALVALVFQNNDDNEKKNLVLVVRKTRLGEETKAEKGKMACFPRLSLSLETPELGAALWGKGLPLVVGPLTTKAPKCVSKSDAEETLVS